MIEGNADELSGILPELIGQYSEHLPKWAQGLVKDPETIKWITEYISKNPDKAKEWFGKLVGKKIGVKNESEQGSPTDDVLSV